MNMEKTAQFNVESVDSLVERFRANGLETINLGLLCWVWCGSKRDESDICIDKNIENASDKKSITGRRQQYYKLVL